MDSTTEILRLLRGRSGKTQFQVADEMKINRSTYCSYENGITPPIATLITVSKYYNVSVDYLLGLTNEKNPNASDMLGKKFERLSKIAGPNSLTQSDITKLIDAMIQYSKSGAKAGSAPGDALREILNAMTDLFIYASGDDVSAVLSAVNDVTRHTLSVTGVLNAFLTSSKPD